jgi:N-methylhydantoinase A
MESGALTRFKEASVPSDPSRSVENGLPVLVERAGVRPDDVELIVHGTTLLVNAIIQRRGAKVALVVSKGNRGILEIARANLAHTQDFTLRKEEPLVPRDLIFETSARTLTDGTVIDRPAEGETAAIAGRIRDTGIEAVSVQLLNSYLHPEMESEVAEELRDHLDGIPVTESAYIWPELGEFERALISIMNAYVQPIMESYLDGLTQRIRKVGIDAPIYITASNGGTVGIETARQRPIDTVLSGPASGVVAAMRVAAVSKHTDIITVDMGGTSCDVSVVQGGEPSFTTQSHVGDLPLNLPVLDVSAIGAGGGSIVWVDPQGVLKIGPQSAGADPGPVCYGRGGNQPTITDCYLLIGYIHPDHFLGGRMQLDSVAAQTALEEVAERAAIDGENRAVKAAAAAFSVATAIMAAELQKGVARRGEDPSDFTLMAFGGAGPTHANLLVEEAGLTSFIVPPASSTFCALGAILADVKRDYVRSQHILLDECDAAENALLEIFGGIQEEAAAWIKQEGDLLGQPQFTATLEMRYAGQAFDLQVPLPDELRTHPQPAAITELFHRIHERQYGFRDLDSATEVMTERLRVTGRITPVTLSGVEKRAAPEPATTRRVFNDGSFLLAPVFLRRDLGEGATIAGPAIVEQEDSTTWILPGWSARVDQIGNMLVAANGKVG